jgi:hypothetical protein
MSAYMTKRMFGGQRAHVTGLVLLAMPKHDDSAVVCLRAGIIVAISSRHDRPYIQDLKTGVVDWAAPLWRYFDLPASVWSVETAGDAHWVDERRGELDIGAMLPMGSWAWPPVL